ncbi:PDR/VanB family oxidoreductase [Novosphingobium sp. KN65.2]|uniref:PDR/VanB family oxidoreductase n=1 Tax=Novosphingobium sp. KN65.2 TaxID=1478134 RepID=UPI0005DE6259|nr:PDR/VanB family oxidoreductase [Novosphingobium sp. KN65.2]CDO35240.1 Phenoxybenzoate dioxygenase subunit beta [Novosphingobium sp. KN65.2]
MTEHHRIEAVVSAVVEQAQGIKTWEFRSADGRALPTFTAGSHIDLHLANGLSRSYSLCNSQDDADRYVVGIAKDPNSRGGSKFIHETLKEGDLIAISAPRNNFPLVEDADHVVLIAGGIGITPMYCMVQRLERLGRSWELWYSCRVKEMCAFREGLETLEASSPGRVHLNFDQEPGGKLTDLKAVIGAAPAGSHFYCCGPNPMLIAFEAAANELGRPQDHVHVEYFAAKEEAALDGGFTVECRKSGIELVIEPGQSILDAMLDADIEIEYSCFEGVCGTCECKVLEGTPDHRDSVLTPEEHAENRRMMVCCSGSRTSRLVLDI